MIMIRALIKTFLSCCVSLATVAGASIQIEGTSAKASQVRDVRFLTDKSQTDNRVASALYLSSSSDAKIYNGARSQSVVYSQLEVKELSRGEGGNEYVPFASNWLWNEILDLNYSYTDNGPDYWPSIREDGLGTLWAIYQGVNSAYSYDTIFVLCSTDNGQTWLYRIAIYGSPSQFDPIFPQLSIDRVNNWVYITCILAEQAGGGTYFVDGTIWVTRFRHTGGGAISNLGTYLCDPNGWGGLYFGAAAAPDGSGSSYLYLCGMDWVGDGVDYWVDYYRSANRGVTWTYINSVNMGSDITNSIAATPRNNGAGAIIGWIEEDDEWNADDNTPPEGDYDYYWRELTSTTQNTYYFNAGGNNFRGLFSISAYGTSRWVAPFDQVNTNTNFDAYFYYYDGSSYWLYTWDNTATDVRSLAMDMITPNNTILMSSYRQSSGLLGRAYFAWATTADVSTWYLYSPCSYDVSEPDEISVPSGGTTKHTDVAATLIPYQTYSWQPHIMWRRTVGAEGGGDPWHSWPAEPTYDKITERSSTTESHPRYKVVYLLYPPTDECVKLYDLTGRETSWTHSGIYIEVFQQE